MSASGPGPAATHLRCRCRAGRADNPGDRTPAAPAPEYRVRVQSTTVSSETGVLAGRPSKTQVQLVWGGNAYAVLSATERCDEALELMTREGISCGSLDLGPPATGCGDARFLGPAIGRDGTIVRPPVEEDAGAGHHPVCAATYWPATLGRSGP